MANYFQPFPLELYFEFPYRIPAGITVGTNERKEILIPNKDLNVHHFLLGKTGAGKTFFLYLYHANFIALGKRFFFIDPLGSTYILLERYIAYMTREYYQKKSFSWFKKEVLDKVVFIDLSNEDHPFRSNFLAPIGSENIEQTINRVIKFFDAEFSPKDSAGDGLDLQRQRRQGLVSLITIFAVTKTPIMDCKKFIYNEDFRETLLSRAEELSDLVQVQESIDYWRFVKETFKGSSYGQLVLSLLTGLAHFFESKIVRTFLLTGESNINWQDLFDNKTVVFKLPINDLATRSILMNFIYTGVLFDLISRRKVDENTDILYVSSDESGVVFDTNYADIITRSRNKMVFFISAMQSRKQGLSDQGMRVIDIIEEQSDNCIYFRIGNDDAVKTINEKLSPQGKRIKHVEKTTSISKSITETLSSGFSKAYSFMKTLMYGQSTQESFTQNFTETLGVSETRSIAETLSEQFSLAEASGETQSVNIGKTYNISWTDGNTMSQTTTDGFTMTQTEGASVAHIETESGTVTISENTTEGFGSSEGQTSSESESISKPYKVSLNNNAVRKTLSNQESQAFQNTKTSSNSFSQGRSEQHGLSRGINNGKSDSEALAISKNLGNSISVLKNFAEGVAQQYSSGTSFTDTHTATQGLGKTIGLTKGLSKNTGQSHGTVVGKMTGEQVSQGQNQGMSLTENESHSKSTGESITISFKNVYYTLEEESRLLAQELRDLPPRRFLLCVKNQKPVFVTTASCYVLPTKRGNIDFLELIRKYNDGEDVDIFPKQTSFQEDEEVEIIEELSVNDLDDDFGHIFKKTDF